MVGQVSLHLTHRIALARTINFRAAARAKSVIACERARKMGDLFEGEPVRRFLDGAAFAEHAKRFPHAKLIEPLLWGAVKMGD